MKKLRRLQVLAALLVLAGGAALAGTVTDTQGYDTRSKGLEWEPDSDDVYVVVSYRIGGVELHTRRVKIVLSTRAATNFKGTSLGTISSGAKTVIDNLRTNLDALVDNNTNSLPLR